MVNPDENALKDAKIGQMEGKKDLAQTLALIRSNTYKRRQTADANTE